MTTAAEVVAVLLGFGVAWLGLRLGLRFLRRALSPADSVGLRMSWPDDEWSRELDHAEDWPVCDCETHASVKRRPESAGSWPLYGESQWSRGSSDA